MKKDRFGRIVPVLGAVALAVFAAFVHRAFTAEPISITVFAAASTTNAVTDIGKAFEAKGLGKVVTSFASSSTLAKQIENGAPAERVHLCGRGMDELSGGAKTYRPCHKVQHCR